MNIVRILTAMAGVRLPLIQLDLRMRNEVRVFITLPSGQTFAAAATDRADRKLFDGTEDRRLKKTIIGLATIGTWGPL